MCVSVTGATCFGFEANGFAVFAFDITFFDLFFDGAGESRFGGGASVVLAGLTAGAFAIRSASTAGFTVITCAISAALGDRGASVVLARLTLGAFAIGRARSAGFAVVTCAISAALRNDTGVVLAGLTAWASAVCSACSAIFAFVGLTSTVSAVLDRGFANTCLTVLSCRTLAIARAVLAVFTCVTGVVSAVFGWILTKVVDALTAPCAGAVFGASRAVFTERPFTGSISTSVGVLGHAVSCGSKGKVAALSRRARSRVGTTAKVGSALCGDGAASAKFALAGLSILAGFHTEKAVGSDTDALETVFAGLIL